MILNKYFLVSFFNNFKNLKTVWNVGIIYLENLLKLETFLYMSKIEYICGFKTTEISELIMSFLNTKTGKKYRVVELDKGIYCLSDILGGRKT